MGPQCCNCLARAHTLRERQRYQSWNREVLSGWFNKIMSEESNIVECCSRFYSIFSSFISWWKVTKPGASKLSRSLFCSRFQSKWNWLKCQKRNIIAECLLFLIFCYSHSFVWQQDKQIAVHCTAYLSLSIACCCAFFVCAKLRELNTEVTHSLFHSFVILYMLHLYVHGTVYLRGDWASCRDTAHICDSYVYSTLLDFVPSNFLVLIFARVSRRYCGGN